MHEEIQKEKSIKNRIFDYSKFLALPLILAFLFAFQNLAFNQWLGLHSKPYLVRVLLVSFALGVVFYGPALLFKKKLKFTYLFFISFLISLIFVAQYLNYEYSQSFLQFSAIKYIGEAGSVTGTIKTLITANLIFFVLNFFLVLVICILEFKIKSEEVVLPNWEKMLVILAMVMIVFFGYKYLLYAEKKEWGSTSRLYSDVYDLKMVVGKMGIMNFFLEDTFKYILRSNLITQKDISFLQNWQKNRVFPVQGKTQKYFGAEKGKNVIIIQVESLENAVINQKIGGEEITPNLNKLAKQGLYFDNYYTQVGPGNTADAEFSTLNSLYPLPDDVAFIDYARNTYSALPQLLTKNGYKTYSLHGDVPTFWNRSNIYPGLGYQRAYDLADYVVTRPVGQGPSDLGDEDLFSQTLPRLESFNNPKTAPFLATVITMSSHTPFILPVDLQTLKIPEVTNLTQTQWEYLQSIHYADKSIGEFVESLKSSGIYDNSLIFIWGDHGSYTDISKPLERENAIPVLSGSQVPMIMFAPELGLKGTTSIPASHLDIYPTIANLLGITAPGSILGQDIFNAKIPVETHFRLDSGGIDAILTDKLSYRASEDGIFVNGMCNSLPDGKSLPINDCNSLYLSQSETVKASNIIIRGNLLNMIAK